MFMRKSFQIQIKLSYERVFFHPYQSRKRPKQRTLGSLGKQAKQLSGLDITSHPQSFSVGRMFERINSHFEFLEWSPWKRFLKIMDMSYVLVFSNKMFYLTWQFVNISSYITHGIRYVRWENVKMSLTYKIYQILCPHFLIGSLHIHVKRQQWWNNK